jgi:hypothetical protein
MADFPGALIPLVLALYETAFCLNARRWTRRADRMVADKASLLLRAVSLPPEAVNHVICVLKFSDRRKKAIWAFLLVLIAFFFALSLYAATVTPQEPKLLTELGMAMLMCAFGSGPWILLLEPYGNVRVLMKNGLIKRSPWTGTAFIHWDEVDKIRWVPLLDSFFVSSKKGIFSINPAYENLGRFAEEVKKNVPRSRFLGAEDKLALAAGGPFQP